MKIIIDAMSGDFAPAETVKGSVLAAEELGVEILLVGNEEEIRNIISENGLSDKNITVHNCEKVITMEDDPSSIIKENRDSSMGAALTLLKNGEGDAVVSAGNTGALLAGGTLIVKRIPGVIRAALAPIMPVKNGGKTMIVDAGANTECRAEMLEQFAVMGSAYMENAENVKNPRVGLANNGTEETKGTPTVCEAYNLLKERKDVNFIGNTEGRGVMLGECDVFVCDGFTGNLVLKSIEGFGVLIKDALKKLFGGFFAKIAALIVLKRINRLKKSLDYKEVGGAVLLGIRKPIVKAHGNSDARAFKNAIRQAVRFADGDTINVIEKSFAKNDKQIKQKN